MMFYQKNISVTILGSGTCVPSLKRSSCSLLMETGRSKLLFDCGPGTMRRLLEAGVEIYDISFIFLSHFHPDHSSELIPFLFANKYPDGSRRKIPLTIAAGKGFSTFFEGLKKVYKHWIDLPSQLFSILEMDNKNPDSRVFNDFKLDTVPVEHNDESIAFKITGSSGVSAVYSGDTDYSENLIELSKDSNILICESALPDALKVKGHLTPSLAGKIADQAGVKSLVLTHFYPECDLSDIKQECRKTYSGSLFIAQDLMKINAGENKCR
ncbi:MBL fold metallo-hydrolase [Desulfobacterales bacterium HSG17]|nr:MBL fold metallo-hydrolase [Desulfobacterales bacterium HSG17]